MDNKKKDLATIETSGGEVKVYEEVKGKYTLVESPIANDQILRMIQRTPQEYVHKRPGKGGGTWDYVTGTYVKKILNYTFGWLWDFQIVDKGREADQVWVHGRLTIKHPKTFNPIIVKEQFGSADIKMTKGTNTPLDYGNDLKAAATDALKKCASEIGIASDIYGKNEFKEIKPETKTAPKQEKTKEETGAKYFAMAADKIAKTADRTVLQGMKDKIAKDTKVYTQQQKLSLIKTINEKLGAKR